MKAMVRTAILAGALLVQRPWDAHAQERAQDRRRWLGPDQVVSDDPRRVPVPATPRGPEGTLVLRGGRVVSVGPDSGAPPPEGAVVKELGGLFLVPGLVESHAHLGGSGGGSARTTPKDR